MNRRHDSAVLLLLDLGVSLIDPVQLDLIERRIAWYGRFVSVPFRCKVQMRLSGHDDTHSIMEYGDGEVIGRIEAGLRKDQRPGAYAGVCGSNLNRGEQSEQREYTNGSSSTDEVNRSCPTASAGSLKRSESAPYHYTNRLCVGSPVLASAAHTKRSPLHGRPSRLT